MSEPEGIRIQKVLSSAGVASRRRAEELIDAGRVEVNGQVVTRQGRRVDPDRDVIRVDGERIPPPRRHAYLMLNKPRGVVSTMDDPQGRPTVADYLGRWQHLGLFHVGRLDADSEGLLLLTNDGELAQRLMHPSHELPKTYVVEVAGVVERPVLKLLQKGVKLDDGKIRPDRVKITGVAKDRTMLTVVIHEGRNRVLRRMFEAVGHPVRRLARVKVGPVSMGQLKLGEVRELTGPELGQLLDSVKM